MSRKKTQSPDALDGLVQISKAFCDQWMRDNPRQHMRLALEQLVGPLQEGEPFLLAVADFFAAEYGWAPTVVSRMTNAGIMGCLLRAIRRREFEKANLPEPKSESEESPITPLWEGDDWERLDRMTRRLLTYMRGRRRASLEEVSREVWEREYYGSNPPTDNAFSIQISRANTFLAMRGWTEELKRPRDERFIRWE
jgi:hypothetical protein